MILNIITALPIVFCFFFLFVAYRLFAKGLWFRQWLRGMGFTVSFVFALVLFLSVYEISSYQALVPEKQIGTVEVRKKGLQHYLVRFWPTGGFPDTYELRGDQWQLDAKVIKWEPFLENFGINSSYRFERISGRYENLKDEYSRERSLYDLHEEAFLPDIWGLSTEYPWLPGVEARYGSGVYVPMKDGANYALFIRRDGMYAKPLNDKARESVTKWN